MKPIKLVMEGFGPYLEKTEIDFEKMDNGLTLISGNTGAGKTTIFDAICCALYGETSGKNRSFTQMRSKSAAPTDHTRIYFEFELKGKKYIVERSPKFLRPKRNSAELTEVPAKATLVYPDGRTVTKVSTVTNEVKDLLGIEKDEFRQIVMIAQNDFMAMIKDTKSNQEETFNRIFGTQMFKNFTNRVRTETGEYKNRRDQISEQIQLELGRLGLEDLSTETNLIRGQIAETLNARSTALREKLPQLKAEYSQIEQERNANLKHIERANMLKNQFTELEEAQIRQAELNGQKEKIEGLRRKTQRAEEARDYIEGIYKEYVENTKHIANLEEQLCSKRKDYQTASAQKDEYSDQLKEYPQDKLLQMQQEQAELTKMIPVYQETAEMNKVLTQLRQNRDQLIQKNEKDIQTLNALTEKIDSAVIYTEEYFSDKRSKNEAVHSKYKEMFERIEELKETLDSMNTNTANYVNESGKLVKLRIRREEVKKDYDEKFDLYIRSQAHFLAEELKPNEPCPVCGSLEHPHPAKPISTNTVTLDELDTLKSEIEALEKQIQNIAHNVDRDDGRIRTGKDNLSKYVSLFNEKNRQFLNAYIQGLDNILVNPGSKEAKNTYKAAGRALNQCIEQIQDAVAYELSETENKAREINSAEEKNKKAVLEKERLEKQKSQYTEVIDDQKHQISELNEKASAQQALLDEKKKVLQYSSLKEAQEALDRKTDQIDAFTGKQEHLQNLEKEAIQKLNRLMGEGQALKSEKVLTEKKRDEAGSNLSARLRERNFTDLNDFLGSRLSPSEIAQNNTQIHNYDTEVKGNKQTLERLKALLQNQKAPDLDSLEEKEKTLKTALEEKREAYSEIEMNLKQVSESRKVIEGLLKKYSAVNQEYEVLYGLDRMVSKRGATFSQYVLSVYFKKVLRKANIKLAEMTNGLYQFRQPKEGQLEIAIFDASTGTTRDIKTLSGGETFTASLALALGFSEVVEEQNGGVRLDTIFIDEGFGSLDPEYLERAIDVLSKLSSERRVAIISHVEQLKERIDQQIVVEKGKNSSKIKLITR